MTECSETLFPFEAHFSRQVVAKKEQQSTQQPARVFTEFFYPTLPSRPGRRLKRGDYVQKATGTGVRAINTKKRQVKKASDKKVAATQSASLCEPTPREKRRLTPFGSAPIFPLSNDVIISK